MKDAVRVAVLALESFPCFFGANGDYSWSRNPVCHGCRGGGFHAGWNKLEEQAGDVFGWNAGRHELDILRDVFKKLFYGAVRCVAGFVGPAAGVVGPAAGVTEDVLAKFC